MPTEHASVRVVHKPRGVGDLRPWSSVDEGGSDDAVGELWFERADKHAPTPALLLKLLFTSQPLSIQVHPDDTFARAMGMPNGQSEAWYILSAKEGAQIGIGAKHRVTPQELRTSIRNGSIVDLVGRRTVAQGGRHLHPGRHHPRHRRRHRAGRNSAAQRRDLPPVRLWQCARVARRQRHRSGPRLAASNAVQADPPLRRPNPSGREPAFRSRAARTARGLELGAPCRTGDVDYSFSTATPRSGWRQYPSVRRSSLAAAAPASRSAAMD